MTAELAALAHRMDVHDSQDAIRKLKAAYMQWLDDRRRGEVATLFWPDAVWEELPYRGAAAGLPDEAGRTVGAAAIADSFDAAALRMSFTAHYLTNEDIVVTGDRAVGRWKLLQACTSHDGVAFWQAGCYTDDFERRDGVWRFAHLRLALDFRTPFDQGWSRTPMWSPTP